MKTIRLVYPDYIGGGGLETYYYGAKLLPHILPENNNHEIYHVEIEKPNGSKKEIYNGIYGGKEVAEDIKKAKLVLKNANPDRIITIGGDCVVSQAPFDYLHGKYDNLGIIWIDAHSDVGDSEHKYPEANGVVLKCLLGKGEKIFTDLLENGNFEGEQIFYLGLQCAAKYQRDFLESMGINCKIQHRDFPSNEELTAFLRKYENILIHLDIDVLDPEFFHSTYFANKNLLSVSSVTGKMKLDELKEKLQLIDSESNIVGLTIAEFLPFEAESLNKMFGSMTIFD